MSMLKELWILTRDGLPIVCINKEGSQSDDLVCGFFSAFKSFSDELTGKDLSCIQVEDEKYTMSAACNDEVLMICKTSDSMKDKSVQKMVKVIRNILERMHDSDALKAWNGNVSFFDNFKSRLDLYFKLGDL